MIALLQEARGVILGIPKLNYLGKDEWFLCEKKKHNICVHEISLHDNISYVEKLSIGNLELNMW